MKITASSLIRWAGLSAMAAGIIFVVQRGTIATLRAYVSLEDLVDFDLSQRRIWKILASDP
jgi:hypothetical protein